MAELDPAAAITDRPLMIRALVVLGLTLVGFLFHSVIGVEAATIALLGATVLMLVGPLDPHESLRDIEWSTLFFFVGLFMLIEAVVQVGIVGSVANGLADVVDGRLEVATIGILWVSTFGSAIVDNIPYTATAIPIVEEMIATGIDGEPLWWALALGACLGGNLTVVGASANIVVVNLAARDGHPITFGTVPALRLGRGPHVACDLDRIPVAALPVMTRDVREGYRSERGSTMRWEWSGREALARRNLPHRPAQAQASPPLRTRSNSRRRRLLGRPFPHSSLISGSVLATTGGLWSTKQVVATAAPTRDSIGRMTSTMRLRSAMSASTRSPARTFVDGFAGDPFTRTWPASHNRVASGRVFTRRTAQSQRSIRVSLVARGSVTRCRMARPRPSRGR